MNDDRDEKKTKQWQLERLLAGDLDSAHAAVVNERLHQEPGGAERLAALKASNEEILRDYPAQLMAQKINARSASAQAAKFKLRLVPALSLSMLSLAAVTVAFKLEQPAAEDVRLKGLQPSLMAYRRSAKGPERLASGATAQTGDVLQLSYIAAGRGFGVIVSVDGRGHVTLHLPLEPGEAARCETQGTHLLPAAYELDDAPAFERFFLVTSAEPFSTAAVMASAQALARDLGVAQSKDLALPTELEQTSLLVKKSLPTGAP